jgi:hypothetical protein
MAGEWSRLTDDHVLEVLSHVDLLTREAVHHVVVYGWERGIVCINFFLKGEEMAGYIEHLELQIP